MLHDSVIRNRCALSIGGCLTAEQSGTLEDVVPLEGVVLLDDLAVNKGDEEDGGENAETDANAEGDGGDVPGGLLAQAETGGALVDDGEGADCAGDEEEEGRGPDGPGDGVGSEVDDDFDERL